MSPDSYTEQTQSLLEREYQSRHPRAEITVYRYNSGSIRLRIIDPDFEGLTWGQRDRIIWDLLRQLPDDVLAEISIRLLLTPAERSTSYLSAEFDNPVVSTL